MGRKKNKIYIDWKVRTICPSVFPSNFAEHTWFTKLCIMCEKYIYICTRGEIICTYRYIYVQYTYLPYFLHFIWKIPFQIIFSLFAFMHQVFSCFRGFFPNWWKKTKDWLHLVVLRNFAQEKIANFYPLKCSSVLL